jgi:hypothetical protein
MPVINAFLEFVWFTWFVWFVWLIAGYRHEAMGYGASVASIASLRAASIALFEQKAKGSGV